MIVNNLRRTSWDSPMERSEESTDVEAIRQKIIGLGETSHRKSYYPQLQEQIDELHIALEALQDSENKHRTLVENVNVGIFRTVAEGKGKFLQANPAHWKMLGYDDERSFLQVAPRDLYFDPDDRDTILKELETASKVKDRKVKMNLRSGGNILVSLTMTAQYDQDGKISLIDGVIEDITEKDMKEEALKQANKKLNLLSSITRHDINNQVMVLDGYLTLALEQTADEEVKRLLQKARKSVMSIEKHISFTKDYQDIGINVPHWVDLRQTLTNALVPLDKASLSLKVEVGEYTIFADPMMGKVFYNLANNVVKHGKASQLWIGTEVKDEGLLVIFEDNGTGIKDKGHLFKRTSSTSGFGLFLSKEILSITGLDIRETGTPGGGARFEIVFVPGKYHFSTPSLEHPQQ